MDEQIDEKMNEQIIAKIVHALPDEGIRELNSLLDGEFDEKSIRDLLDKYNVNLEEIVAEERKN